MVKKNKQSNQKVLNNTLPVWNLGDLYSSINSICPSRVSNSSLKKSMSVILSPYKLIDFANSKAELSVTPRYAEVAVTEPCPSNLLTASTSWVSS